MNKWIDNQIKCMTCVALQWPWGPEHGLDNKRVAGKWDLLVLQAFSFLNNLKGSFRTVY